MTTSEVARGEVARGEAAATELARLGRDLLTHLEPAAADARYATADESSWSAIEVLAHAVEFVGYWAEQARAVGARTDGGDRPFGRTHDDPTRIAAVREHAHDRYEALAQRLGDVITTSAATLRAIPEGQWSRTAVHARRGSMSVEQIVRQFLLSHLEEHAAQVSAALGKP